MATVNRPPPWRIAPLPTESLAMLAALAAVSAVAWPLATYTLTLAVFGLPHVASELSWLRRRFGGWLGRLLLPLGLLLLSISGLRVLGLLGLVSRPATHAGELLAGALLVLVVAPRWMRGPWAGRVIGLLVTALLVGGLLFAPVHTLLLVAVLHNWTPVPLMAEALAPEQKPRLFAVALLVFGALPLLVATGLPWQLLHGAGMGSSELGFPRWGTLQSHLGAYLPRELLGWSGAQHLFSAVVFAQCLHYIAVIGVLPRLGPEPLSRGPLPRGNGRGLVLVGTAVLFVGYLLDFRLARSTYGVVASIHAWIEVPLLVLALLPQEQPEASRDPRAEAPVAGAATTSRRPETRSLDA